jgi:hypothetical protein
VQVARISANYDIKSSANSAGNLPASEVPGLAQSRELPTSPDGVKTEAARAETTVFAVWGRTANLWKPPRVPRGQPKPSASRSSARIDLSWRLAFGCHNGRTRRDFTRGVMAVTSDLDLIAGIVAIIAAILFALVDHAVTGRMSTFLL